MTDVEPFAFKPRTKLILENLETARSVLSLCQPDGEVVQEVEQFTAWLEAELRRRLPKLDIWKTEVSEDEILLYPDDSWNVLGKEDGCVHISVSFLQVTSGYPEDMLDDGGVGLFVPKKWIWRDEFREELYDQLPSKLRSMRFHEAEWPLWKHVRLEPGEIGESIAAYVDKTERIVSDLVDVGDDISGLLRNFRRRRVRS